jgi:hypothetical protein
LHCSRRRLAALARAEGSVNTLVGSSSGLCAETRSMLALVDIWLLAAAILLHLLDIAPEVD